MEENIYESKNRNQKTGWGGKREEFYSEMIMSFHRVKVN